jgi:hypothetical protein
MDIFEKKKYLDLLNNMSYAEEVIFAKNNPSLYEQLRNIDITNPPKNLVQEYLKYNLNTMYNNIKSATATEEAPEE